MLQARKKKKETKPCKHCKQDFVPYNSLQKVCGPKCAIAIVEEENAARALRLARKRTREDKERIKTYSQLVQEAEAEARRYARIRDKDKPCPSCLRHDHELPDVYNGGKWDGGHFMGKGAHPELRFHPFNIFAQCKSCNSGQKYRKSKEKSVSEQFEATLREWIGDRMVDYLTGPQQAQNWTHDDLREIKAYYREQIKLLKQEFQ